MTAERIAWLLIGADAMGLWMLAMLLLHRPTQRRWLAFLAKRAQATVITHAGTVDLVDRVVARVLDEMRRQPRSL